ncbi:hypothetical protein [Macrococcoides canis]|uniref:hypothetical protein n=1 Tax=Macrococcoides canis TaxID=1855823 RepID=UPI0020B8F1A7|nr:hypothetical protein [Macrococcus canis]UTG99508.1 hypothetical protein KFV04_08360 [Macrococcus canis]
MNSFLRLEYVNINHMIMTVEIDAVITAVIFYEDLNRKGDLHKDFPFLIPVYFNENDKLDDDRNLVSIQIFPLYEEDRSLKYKEHIEALAEAFIEHRETMNIKINWIDDVNLTNLYQINKEDFIKKIISYSENEIDSSIEINNLNHLHQ